MVFPQPVRFEAQQERGENKYFLYFAAYTVPTRRPAGRGRVSKWLIFGGPCRGRTYGPLIKRSGPVRPRVHFEECASTPQGAYLSFPFNSIVSMMGFARYSFPHVRPVISSNIPFFCRSITACLAVGLETLRTCSARETDI